MKKLVFYIITLASIVSFSCGEDEIPANCIDPEKITEGPCTTDYTPVCGCDGKNYGNECHAMRSGVLTWKTGRCE